MTRVGDLTGRVFERLTVLDQANDERNGATRWRCRCVCGVVVEVRGANLVSGGIKSCGCLRRESARARARGRNRAWPRSATGHLRRKEQG